MMTDHIEGRLAFLKAERQGGTNGLSLPDRLDAQEQFMAARLDGLRATSKVLKALYGSLSGTQKQTTNELIRSSTGMM